MRLRNAVTLVWAIVSATAAGCGSGGGSRGGFLSAASTASTSSGTTATTSSATTATTTTATTAPVGTHVIAKGTFRALTYNVAGLPQGISASQPLANHPQIAPLLNAYDLVLVQEDFVYHHLLTPGAKHPYQTPHLTNYGTLVGDGLNAFSRFPIGGLLRTRWLDCNGWYDQSNDCLSSKGFFYCQVEVAPGLKVDVYNHHADAGGSSGDIATREKQFRQLADAIRALSNGRPVIVAGDTNLKSHQAKDEAVLQKLMTTVGLQDCARMLGGAESIDRFLYRGTADLELQPLKWRFADEFVDAKGQPLSDHEAINVDFEWRQVR